MITVLCWQWYLEHRARHWRQTQAIVLDSRVEWRFAATKGLPTRDHVVKVKYRLALPEGGFEGDTHAPLPWAMTRDEASSEVSRLAPGSATTVHYDPDDPTRSAIHRLHPENSRWLLGFGLLLLSAGVSQTRRSLEPSRADRPI